MIGAIADLYLTAKVLILLDGSYGSRFWVRAAARPEHRKGVSAHLPKSRARGGADVV